MLPGPPPIALVLAIRLRTDRLLFQKLVYLPERGDVIVFSVRKGSPGVDRAKVIDGAFAVVWPPARVGWIH